MNKKIIAAALAILAVAVLFAACKKDDPEKTGNTNVKDEVTVDENGDMYVTNVDGDKIPVTTDEDGFYDDIEALKTETTTNKSSESSTRQPSSSASSENGEKETGSSKPTESESSGESESSSSSGIQVGTGSGKQDSVSWQEIVDNENKTKNN